MKRAMDVLVAWVVGASDGNEKCALLSRTPSATELQEKSRGLPFVVILATRAGVEAPVFGSSLEDAIANAAQVVTSDPELESIDDD